MALHDDWKAAWKVLLKAYHETNGRNEEEYNALRKVRAQNVGMDIALQYPGEVEFISDHAGHLCGDDVAVFYFEDAPTREDDTLMPLLDTASEFYREGILQAPFEKVLFIFRYNIFEKVPTGPQFVASKVQTGIGTAIFAVKRPNGYGVYCFLSDTGLKLNKSGDPVPVPGAVLDYQYQYAGKITDAELIDSELAEAKTLFAPPDRGPKELQWAIACSAAFFLTGLMLLNIPQYEKNKTTIDPKLARAREKNDKPPLQGYTTVRMKREIYNALSDGKGGWTVKPHWRRGHIRRWPMKDGTEKLIPVQPTMVNFDGPADMLQKNIYNVEGNEDAKTGV